MISIHRRMNLTHASFTLHGFMHCILFIGMRRTGVAFVNVLKQVCFPACCVASHQKLQADLYSAHTIRLSHKFSALFNAHSSVCVCPFLRFRNKYSFVHRYYIKRLQKKKFPWVHSKYVDNVIAHFAGRKQRNILPFSAWFLEHCEPYKHG